MSLCAAGQHSVDDDDTPVLLTLAPRPPRASQSPRAHRHWPSSTRSSPAPAVLTDSLTHRRAQGWPRAPHATIQAAGAFRRENRFALSAAPNIRTYSHIVWGTAGMTLDERTDVWALGCTLFAMAFLQSPFELALGQFGGSIGLAVMSGKYAFPDDHRCALLARSLGWLTHAVVVCSICQVFEGVV